MAAINDADEDADHPDARLPVRTRDDDAGLVERVRAEIDAAAHYAAAAQAPSTRQAYARDWLAFTAWCAGRELIPLPADPRAVAVFLQRTLLLLEQHCSEFVD